MKHIIEHHLGGKPEFVAQREHAMEIGFEQLSRGVVKPAFDAAGVIAGCPENGCPKHK